MSYAVISDVHSNLHALNAVLFDIRTRGIDEIYFVGDAVGYGPQPDTCIEALKSNCNILLAGNHDWAVIGYTSIQYFNEYARRAVIWTQENISSESFEDLEKFMIAKTLKEKDALLVHSTPKDPEMWHYLFTLSDAEKNFNYFKEKICFIGHSHSPIIIERNDSGEILVYAYSVEFKNERQYIINVGSVGQPRDGDPRASYAVLNDESVEIVRVEYDIKKTQEEMEAADLPRMLIDRLSYGR